MFPIYTKTFGGKIWRNLHSVSPDNNFDKIFKMVNLKISRQKKLKHNLVQKLSGKKLNQVHVRIFDQVSANGF